MVDIYSPVNLTNVCSAIRYGFRISCWTKGNSAALWLSVIEEPLCWVFGRIVTAPG